MTRIQVVSTVGGTESDRAFGVLSRWAANYIDRKNRQCSRQMQPTAEILVDKTHARQIAVREKVFEQYLPFSWPRFLIGFISLLLVFSDIFRGGLGVNKLETYYPVLQPDEVLGFGTSWNYSVFAATKDETYRGDIKASVWSYKFDSTSIVWRTIASHFRVTDYLDCLLYRSQCPGETFDSTVAFRMIDGIANAVANMNNTVPTHKGPVGITLRSENEYIDRLHQFLLPKWFTNYNWRTNQALYYSPHFLETQNARSICFPVNGGRVRTPHFCNELWTNLDRSCAPKDMASRAAGLLYVHTMERLRAIQNRFTNMTVDLTFLESQEDLQVCRGGLSMTGFRRSDVSTIIRARNCSDTFDNCETVFLEDYRYETGMLNSDVVQWYRLVAALRAIGQVYFWLRGIGLLISCYFIYGALDAKKNEAVWTRLQRARNLFMKVPTQCVVYGSSFPVASYVLAHLFDAPFAYNVLESHFFSQAGVLQIDPQAFISYAVVQMRSVWIYALAWHLVVRLSTTNLFCFNKLKRGITGVPEFLLSSFSSATLIAQYRSTSFRSSKVLRVMELPSNMGRAWEAIKYQYNYVHRGRGSVLLGGVVIDLKFLICLLFLVATMWSLYVIWSFYWGYKFNNGKHSNAHWFLLPPTPVPYSAGVLWSTVSVCVQWPTNYYCIRDEQFRGMKNCQQHRCRFRLLGWNYNANARVVATTTTVSSKYLPKDELHHRKRFPRKNLDTYQYIQHRFRCLHRRSIDVEANVAFMNAVLMSDPLVYLNLVFGPSDLAYYQSIWRPQQIQLLPVAAVGEWNEFASGLKLLKLVNTSELTWSELIQCG